MASIHEVDDSPYWSASFRNAAGKLCKKSTKMLREPADSTLARVNAGAAMRIAEEFERRAKAGLPAADPATPPPPLAGIPIYREFTRAWMRGLGGGEDYHNKVTGYFDTIDQHLGDKTNWQICRLHESHFAGLKPFLLEKGYSPTTATAHLKALRQAFLAAQQQGYVLVCPITPQDYLENPSPNRPKPLSIPQIECLANATNVIDWRIAIMLGFYCAMELLEAVSQIWDNVNFASKIISWKTFTRRGKSIMMDMPLHPLLERHLLAVKNIAPSEFMTPALRGVSDSALRARFRDLVEQAQLSSPTIATKLHRDYHEVQFASIKLAFAKEIGHTALFRLSKFLRLMSDHELKTRVAKLPHLQLKSIPLLTLDKPSQ